MSTKIGQGSDTNTSADGEEFKTDFNSTQEKVESHQEKVESHRVTQENPTGDPPEKEKEKEKVDPKA